MYSDRNETQRAEHCACVCARGHGNDRVGNLSRGFAISVRHGRAGRLLEYLSRFGARET